MSIHSLPVLALSVSPLAAASPSDDKDGASSDARWAAWVERTRQHDRAFKRKLRLGLLAAAGIGLLVALVVLGFTAGAR